MNPILPPLQPNWTNLLTHVFIYIEKATPEGETHTHSWNRSLATNSSELRPVLHERALAIVSSVFIFFFLLLYCHWTSVNKCTCLRGEGREERRAAVHRLFCSWLVSCVLIFSQPLTGGQKSKKPAFYHWGQFYVSYGRRGRHFELLF